MFALFSYCFVEFIVVVFMFVCVAILSLFVSRVYSSLCWPLQFMHACTSSLLAFLGLRCMFELFLYHLQSGRQDMHLHYWISVRVCDYLC